MSVIKEITAERLRQIGVEGFTYSCDDGYVNKQLASAAAAYILADASPEYFFEQHIPQGFDPTTGAKIIHIVCFPKLWPWNQEAWKPKDRRRNLIRAAALLVAEIERIDRASVR